MERGGEGEQVEESRQKKGGKAYVHHCGEGQGEIKEKSFGEENIRAEEIWLSWGHV